MKKVIFKLKSAFNNICNSNKKKVAFISLIVAVSLLVCGTFAWYFSQVNLNGNQLTTGTIDFIAKGYDQEGKHISTILKEGQSPDGIINPNHPLFVKSNWAASDVGTCYLSVERTGTLDMEYALTFTADGDIEYLGGYWYRVKEITYDVGNYTGNDESKLMAYASAANHKPVPCDAKTDHPSTCTVVDGEILHNCTECKETSYNMTSIDRLSTRGVLQEEQTDKRFYQIDYGVRHNAYTLEYTNKTVQIAAKVYATQIGAIDNPDGTGETYTVSNRETLDEAIDNALPGDSIMLLNDFIYDGDLIFNKCINFISAGKTLTVNGNVIYNFVASHTLKLDFTGRGRLRVQSTESGAGGNLTFNTPNSQVDLIGTNLTGDIYVSKTLTVNATRALGTGGFVLTNIRILDDNSLPKTIYLESDTRITVNSGVLISRIEAVAQATNIEIQNNGEIDEIVLSHMTTVPDAKSPQIYIHNYAKINETILLPVWSVKFQIVQEEPLITTGNTKIVSGLGAAPMTVKGGSFTNEDIIDESDITEFVVPLNEGSTSLLVYFTDKVEGTTSTLQSFLEDYFRDKKNLSGSVLNRAIESITHLEIITIKMKEISHKDIEYLKGTLTSLASLDISNSTVQNNTIPANAFRDKTSLTHIDIPIGLANINADAFNGTSITNITIPAAVDFIGQNALININFVTFESATPENYTSAGLTNSIIFVNEFVLSDYRSRFASLALRIYPKSEICDDGINAVRDLGNGQYELTVHIGNLSEIAVGENLTINYNTVNVTSIGENAFRNLSHQFSVSFAQSVESVSAYAFYQRNITSVNFANVKFIGDYAFIGCKYITKIDAGKIENIGIAAFRDCINLIEINLPSLKVIESPTSANDGAFAFCANLVKIGFKEIYSIGLGAFYRDNNIREITFANDKINGITVNNSAFGFTYDKLLRVYAYKENIDILKTIGGFPTAYLYEIGTKVGKNLYKAYDTTNQLIGEVDLGMYIVNGPKNDANLVCCNLETLPENYVVPANTRDIDSSIAASDAMVITSVSKDAFRYNTFKDTNIVFGDTITHIGEYAFYYADINTLDLNQVESIEAYAFAYSSVSTVDFGITKNVGDFAFIGCNYLKSIDDSNLIETIGSYSFADCTRLYLVDFPNVLTVSNNVNQSSFAFRNCTSLISASFGPNVYDLGKAVFSGANNIREIIIQNANASGVNLNNALLQSCNTNMSDLRIYVPADQIDTYRTKLNSNAVYELGYKVGENIVEVKSGNEILGAVNLGVYTVCDYDGGVSISSYNISAGEIPNDYVLPQKIDGKDVVRIGYSCFRLFPFESISFGDSVAENFVFPSTLIEIADYAFYETNICVKDFNNIKSIGTYAFYNCKNMYIVNAFALEELGDVSFASNTNMVSFNAPKLSSVGISALADCTKLIQLITDVQTVGNNWMRNLNSLRELWVATTPGTSINFNISSGSQYITLTSEERVTNRYLLNANTAERVGSAPKDVYNTKGVKVGVVDLGEYFVETVDGGKKIIYCNIQDAITGTAKDPFDILDSVGEVPVVAIGKYAFWHANFTDCVIRIPDTIKTIEEYAFDGKGITGILDLKQVVNVGNNAFQSTKITSLIAPRVTTVGVSAFNSCVSLISVNAPSLVTINNTSFAKCTKLESLYFENIFIATATSFQDSRNVTSLTINKSISASSELPSITGWNYFPNGMILYVPAESVEIYKANSNFTRFSVRQLGGVYTDSFGNQFSVLDKDDGYELINCMSSNQSVTIPDSFDGKNVISISAKAFVTSSIINLTLPQYYKHYTDNVFMSNNTIQNIYVHENNQYFKSSSNSGSSLYTGGVLYTRTGSCLVYYPKNKTATDYTILSGTEVVYSYAFKDNGKLSNVTVPNSVIVMGVHAFEETILSSIEFLSSNPPYVSGTQIFDEYNIDLKIYVPSGKASVYKNALGFMDHSITAR